MSDKSSPTRLRLPLPPWIPPRRRALHVRRDARERYQLPIDAFGIRGRVVHVDFELAERWAEAMNRRRAGAVQGVTDADAAMRVPIAPAMLPAAALLHELMHALIASMVGGERPGPVAGALEGLRAAEGAPEVARFLVDLAGTFPPPQVASGALAAEAYVAASTEGEGNDAVLLEEFALLLLADENRALAPLRELFDVGALRRTPLFAAVARAVEASLDAVAVPVGPDRGPTTERRSLLALLRAPRLASPDSLLEQLRLALDWWGPLLGGRFQELLRQALRAIDVLEETAKGGPPGPGPWGSAEELVPGFAAASGEPEAFTPDRAWMPNVVMVAKSTYVWLEQLARSYGREVARLDQVPDEALAGIAADGFNALWLIGVWQRSEASRRIKRLRGQSDAEASAYAVHDYVVAHDLGGEEALAVLRERAARHGVRLASDMVPNHTGIDARWVVEHPERFVDLDHPPFAGYTFHGPDLSGDARVEIRIEDHYFDGSDAAVVFQRKDVASGAVRYVYHGNDGTAMPWNDTAQLDYLREDVRAAVSDTIVEVARRFPIIRFDAAMTLARTHVRRLWHPSPGDGGAVPSRSRFGVSEAEFDARMPREFWREVVERMARDAPDTLLLAEAFWLMEGYFVRSLGMHRVYNSAFMHMLMREENAAYRRLIRSVQAFDPRVLERFVNFMSNPDEESAAEQFGTGEKSFGVAVLMATLPGLPMFGHGQVEGLREKYGMEYRRAKLDERPDPELVRRHREQVAPLLRLRARFAGATTFRLFDLVGDDGRADEDVYVFSNRSPGGAVLVAVNNSGRPAQGRARVSAPFADHERGGALRSETLVEALGLRQAAGRHVTFEEHVGAGRLEASLEEIGRTGLTIELAPYQARVFTEVRQHQEAPPTVPVAAPAPPAAEQRPHRIARAAPAGPRGTAARRRRGVHRRARTLRRRP